MAKTVIFTATEQDNGRLDLTRKYVAKSRPKYTEMLGYLDVFKQQILEEMELTKTQQNDSKGSSRISPTGRKGTKR